MPAGFQIFRDDGTLQIDDTYKTLALKEVRTVTVTADATAVMHSLTVTGANVMIAVRCELLHYATRATWVSGSTWTITLLFASDGPLVAENVKLYLFSDPVLEPGNCGLEVYNAAGQLVFSGNTKPIRIEGVVSGGAGFAGVPGRLYAPILLSRADSTLYFNGVLWDVYYSFLRCSAHTIGVTPKFMRRVSGIRRASTGVYLAADVTNY